MLRSCLQPEEELVEGVDIEILLGRHGAVCSCEGLTLVGPVGEVGRDLQLVVSAKQKI